MYYYWGFGLAIASEIDFPELLPLHFSHAPDLTITLGVTPEQLTDTEAEHTPVVSISPNRYLLKLFNIANYFAENGNSIVVERLSANDDKSLRLFLLNSVISALLYQRNNVMLHASAITFENGAVLFCGPASSGKSALAAGMMQKGYKIVSDDVCLIQSPAPEVFEAVPSYPMYMLWKDSFVKMNISLPGENYKIRPDLSKYGIHYHEQFDASAKLIKRVFILNKTRKNNEPAIKKLTPVESFTQLHNNNFYRAQIYPMKKQALSFLLLAKLVNTITVYEITWYDGGNSIDNVCALVEKNLAGNGRSQ